ncbi:class I SAM-dependent methyltransferase [Pararcticibacter amylolyticus]|uniref:Class I SAM-dependent methyltransferase n=1 Tax=Pararcticibacter amylolyticus TaxID=2173175 RepID=A0A2U2PMB8_9SPHI|nr:class I SAM-dependent methyltransferase [Pararcticibacter amylolyticus]PWG82444.1 class I SAM-dependent methyltransferase [Pararcticibacter amylolyticus]
MESGERNNVYKVYNKIAGWYSENRNGELAEKKHLDQLIEYLPAGAQVLDLGCGTGKPILEYLLSKNFDVTGVDASSKVLEIAKANFPAAELILADMRALHLKKTFDAIIAWHSFFHLPADDQPAMFKIFEEHINPRGILLFTSGTERGEAWGTMGGESVFHASLDTKEYEILLARHSFKILKHIENDPDCGNATIWMAQRI